MSRSPADAELFGRVHAGDLSALGVLFDRYAADVERVVLRLGVSVADVDDVVQATFLEVLKCAERFDGRGTGKGFLIGLAVMLVRRRRRSLGRMAERLRAWASLPSNAPPTPEENSFANQTAERAQRALAQLSAKKREVFVLITLEGLNGEEAAQSLGIPLRTVWTRLHHARQELRASLEDL